MAFSVRKFPFPISAGGKEVRGNPNLIPIPTALSSAEVAPGSFMVIGSGGYEAFATANVTCGFWVQALFDANMRSPDWQYFSAAQLAASLHYFSGIPVGGVLWEIGEDAAGGAMPDTAPGQFVSLVVSAMTDTSGQVPFGEATPNIVIDSSTLAGSASGAIVWQVMSLSAGVDTPAFATGTARNWVIRLSDASATASQ